MALITFIVEDNKTIRDNLIPSLEDLANAAVAGIAETENEAIAWLETHRGEWHLAVVDLFLKQGSGLGVLAACRERGDQQRVVVLSNYATSEMKARCAALGADAVFDKSNDLDAFFEYCNADRPSQLAPL
ncbi:response regulator [Variovorax sp. PAMC 28711]|uniref:response regulator n=1 Tax=Variovorax sp. PAMC 28711 TaxID=1795631 RepID=UPI00078DF358|nr:response regulator [Variovorax sp. PAMC 28711]AMM25875.1 hypothetical protein AX767_17070 [Variovorax sp. PAMC 28711]